jgi:GTPase
MDYMNNNSTNEKPYYSGFITVIGKPNAGKSTLVNSIVGTKVAITSPKPQTTRHRILGVKNGENYQLVFVDTPGVHKPQHELGRYLEKTYRGELKEAEAAILVADGTHPPTDEDIRARDILFRFEKFSGPIFLVINKIDAAKPERLEEAREKFTALGNFTQVFEISALKKLGLDELEKAIVKILPEGPPYFPPDMQTDQSPELAAAEVVREKVLMKTRQEVPHSVFVHTEEMRQGAKPEDLYISMYIYVEKESQKGIIIGKGGARLKQIGRMAREEMEFMFGKHVYLDIRVKVKEDWKDRKDLLKSWGYEL